LNADELRALLSAAAAYRHGIILPYFAVCTLAGIRPDEAKRIGWEHVSFADREIRVPAEASKTGDPREVEMPDALVAWLECVPIFQRTGLFAWSRGMFEKVRNDAGLTARWMEPKGSDILRHSAASHDYRLHGSMEKTAAKMGHDVMVFKSHYKAVVATRAEAEAYFKVLPAHNAGTVEFRQVAS
jgi:integrase